ncbi:MAG: hypothetical protein ABJB34_03980 [Acidobacteriota bacterium]
MKIRITANMMIDPMICIRENFISRQKLAPGDPYVSNVGDYGSGRARRAYHLWIDRTCIAHDNTQNLPIINGVNK